ncbi:acyl-ACP--UDP-N-acetylglucosamine O-acyltransferase [Caldimonas tepidiphila]|uniref:acyl-ACP--UDP-N-acetylglucosamine O-acyltransferase n=1 Tax=Caldimonas tepidiphila TaxID=2315841 RepID=UPI001F0BF576|nr:acyl-ACP--UDP-N-acetylglucosamine O-acyltransferase [Caldimonas tepidiphila]
MANIHPTAIVDAKAELAESVTVGAYTLIGPHVRVGAGTSIGPHCVIEGHTTIGADNRIFQFCSLGAAPQDKKYAGEPTELRIGDRNTIREFCTFNLGTVQDGGVTSIGNDNWIMAYVHLAHDCRVGDGTIFANNSQLAGHVIVGDRVILGGFTVVHQFVKIGAHSMTGMGTVLFQDVPPFVMATGNTAKAHGFNLEGLKRRGFSAQRLSAVKQMYRSLYRRGLTLEQARAEIAQLGEQLPEAQGDIALMLDFLAAADRGIVR